MACSVMGFNNSRQQLRHNIRALTNAERKLADATSKVLPKLGAAENIINLSAFALCICLSTCTEETTG